MKEHMVDGVKYIETDEKVKVGDLVVSSEQIGQPRIYEVYYVHMGGPRVLGKYANGHTGLSDYKVLRRDTVSDYKLSLDDNKYTVIMSEDMKVFKALRHGEEWRSLVGDNLIYFLVSQLKAIDEILGKDLRTLVYDAWNQGKSAVDMRIPVMVELQKRGFKELGNEGRHELLQELIRIQQQFFQTEEEFIQQSSPFLAEVAGIEKNDTHNYGGYKYEGMAPHEVRGWQPK